MRREDGVVMVVTMDSKQGINFPGGAPGNIDKGWQLFRELTTYPFEEGKKNAVIMGRNTWDKLPNALPDRFNIVLTSSYLPHEGDCITYDDLEGAIGHAKDNLGAGKVFIMGGAQVYSDALDFGLVDEVYVIRLKGEYACDKFFPEDGFINNALLLHHIVDVDDSLHIEHFNNYDKADLIHKTKSPEGFLLDKKGD